MHILLDFQRLCDYTLVPVCQDRFVLAVLQHSECTVCSIVFSCRCYNRLVSRVQVYTQVIAEVFETDITESHLLQSLSVDLAKDGCLSDLSRGLLQCLGCTLALVKKSKQTSYWCALRQMLLLK